jgi:hypothetical protein
LEREIVIQHQYCITIFLAGLAKIFLGNPLPVLCFVVKEKLKDESNKLYLKIN